MRSGSLRELNADYKDKEDLEYPVLQYWFVLRSTRVQACIVWIPCARAIFSNSAFSAPGLKMIRLGCKERM